MSLCRPLIKCALIYHDNQDWLIEQRGEGYWSLPLNGEAWLQGLPSGVTRDDAALIFSTVPMTRSTARWSEPT